MVYRFDTVCSDALQKQQRFVFIVLDALSVEELLLPPTFQN